MTRAARHAQRAGAAALRFDYGRADRDLAMPRQYLRSSFLLAPAPARWHLGILWAGAGGATWPGSPVPHGPGGGTGNALISLGSAVPFRRASRDARTDVAARVCAIGSWNHRTTEPQNENGRNQPFLEPMAVLSRFHGSGANILMGRYSAAPRSIAGSADLGLIGGGGWRKFRGPVRAGGAIGQAGGNGGFLRFFDGARGHVGMGMLERERKSVAFQVLGDGRRKPAGLADDGPRGGAGGGAAWAPPTPPSRPRPFPLTLTLTFFRVSIDLPIRGIRGQRLDRDGRLAGSPETGSGERGFPLSRSTQAGDAVQGDAAARVGDGGVPVSAATRRDPQGLWAGVRHVNG